jgi:uncharacterized damage-inducible protein DinB
MNQRFEHDNMAGAVFNDINLGDAIFSNVNLGGATFTNINFEGVLITNANLHGLRIEDANISGLTVFGFNVGGLIEAERDRSDPERAALRMGDVHDPNCVREAMNRLEQRRAKFRARLRACDPAPLNAAPTPGEWSALQTLRHMVFAEDLYLNRYIMRNDQPWNPHGLLPAHLLSDPAYAAVASAVDNSLETVLQAWDEVHTATRTLLQEITPARLRQDAPEFDQQPCTVGNVLQLLARHDLDHMRQAEKALAAQEPVVG